MAPKRKKQPSKNEKQDRRAEELERTFAEFDVHKNGRLQKDDIVRLANDYGVDLLADEANDMIRFWDTSGTNTLSADDFRAICQECAKGAKA